MNAKILHVTENIILRAYTEDDISPIAQAGNDKEIADNMGSRFPHPYTEEEASNWVAHCTETYANPEVKDSHWCIEINGEVAGGAGLEKFDEGLCNTGYWLARKHWGNGHMTKIVHALTEYALSELDIHRVEAAVVIGNTGSARVLEKNHYKQEGIFRKAFKKQDGTFEDEYRYAVLKEDFFE